MKGIYHFAVTARHNGQDWFMCSITPQHLKRGIDEANARLIAAAPDLLNALADCLSEADVSTPTRAKSNRGHRQSNQRCQGWKWGGAMSSLRFPRTFRGWKVLAAVTLRRCPLCWGPLLRDWAPYDDGDTVYCLPCGGAILPRGFWRALVWNARSYKQTSPGSLQPQGQHPTPVGFESRETPP